MTSAAAQAGLRTVVTSRAFVEKAGLELPDGVEVIWIEDLQPGDQQTDERAIAMALACLAPDPADREGLGHRENESRSTTPWP